jgi:rfaE bifunctional protein nucleotidyltransferase chain/domain
VFRNKILEDIDRAVKICGKLRKKNKSIVLVGGVFDLLHYGHLKFLQAAKKEGDILIVALESDKNVRTKKGRNRPIHREQIRAEILAELECVDYVLILPEMRTPDYFKLVEKLRPDIIAVTENDPQIENKRKQAKSVGGKLAVVTPCLPTPSTTQLARILRVE